MLFFDKIEKIRPTPLARISLFHQNFNKTSSFCVDELALITAENEKCVYATEFLHEKVVAPLKSRRTFLRFEMCERI